MSTLNLGILAHVDAGKTSLTERLLFAAGVIDTIGRVDDGSTQTDTLVLERQRGITIKSAVVSFAVGDLTVNLIDTPGHPDFIAEVERTLAVLDGAVLMISAVEGVQAQTRVLMRALTRLALPTLMFMNKIDRRGARVERVLAEIREKLSPRIVPLGSVQGQGTRHATVTPYGAGDAAFAARLADVIADHDDEFLAAYLHDDRAICYGRARAGLASLTRDGLVHPVFSGSAITGAGVDALASGLAELLPAADAQADGPVSGTVFKVERGPAGEKIAYVRMFSGTVQTRDRLRFGPDRAGRVTAARVFDRGPAAPGPASAPGRSGSYGASAPSASAIPWVPPGCPWHPPGGITARSPGGRSGAAFPPAHAGNRGRARIPRRPGCAARRARPARRAGPADQRAPGRCPPGDPRLALR